MKKLCPTSLKTVSEATKWRSYTQIRNKNQALSRMLFAFFFSQTIQQ